MKIREKSGNLFFKCKIPQNNDFQAIQIWLYNWSFLSAILVKQSQLQFLSYYNYNGGRTGLMVRASDSGSGDPGSILGRVGVFVSLSKRHLLPKSTGNTQE